MNEIEQIYRNQFGIAFYWKKGDARKQHKIQLVFRDTGFYLTRDELTLFLNCSREAASRGCCADCKNPSQCRSILLRTPSQNIDLAVSLPELEAINDLIEGTLFNLDLQSYLRDVCRN